MITTFSQKITLLVTLALVNFLNAGITDLFSFGTDANYGTILSGVIEKSATTIINNGDYYAMQKVSLKSNNFKGTGLVEAPTIYITTKKFEFTGTLRCHGTCIIHAGESFDENMFKREGDGKFIIIVGENNMHKQQVFQESFSLEPLKNAIVEFPSHNPFKTIGFTTGIVLLCGYKIVKFFVQ